jgi:hypothetical protein
MRKIRNEIVPLAKTGVISSMHLDSKIAPLHKNGQPARFYLKATEHGRTPQRRRSETHLTGLPFGTRRCSAVFSSKRRAKTNNRAASR